MEDKKEIRIALSMLYILSVFWLQFVDALNKTLVPRMALAG